VAAGAQRDLDEDHAVAAGDTQIGRVEISPDSSVLGDDLELVLLGILMVSTIAW